MLFALTCLVAQGAAVAEVVLADGTTVRARPGALEVGGASITPCDGMPDAAPIALAAAGTQVAVGFREGAFLFDPIRRVFSPVGPRASVRALAVSGDTLYVGTAADGLWRVRAGKSARVPGPLGRGEISALAASAAGVEVGAGARGWWRAGATGPGLRVQKGVYAGCFRRGKPRSPGSACAPPARSEETSGLPSAHLTTLAVHGGALYAGTFDHGLARLSRGRPAGVWTEGRALCDRREDAGKGRAEALCKDGDHFVPVAGAPPFINTLASAADGLYIGTPKGLYRLDAAGVTRVALGGGLDHVNALLVARDGTLWIATSGGVAARGPDGRLRFLGENEGLPGRIAHSLAEGRDGAIWIGTLTGLVRLGRDGMVRFSRAAGNLPHDWVTALLPDGDDMLAGTYDAGVWRLTAGGRGAPIAGLEKLWVNPSGLARAGGAVAVATLGDGLVLDGREVEKLPSRDVTAVTMFAGKMWIATRGGLAVGELR